MALEFSAAFDLLKSLASKVGGKTEVTNEDVEKMMKEADSDGDGIVSESEFKEVYMSTEEYEKLEEDYLEAFEAIAGLDGEDGVSEADMESAAEKYAEETEESEAADAGGGSGGSGGSGGGPGGTNPGSKPTTNPDSQSDGSLDPVTLSENNTMDELSGKRTDAMNTLSEQREARDAAAAEAEAKVDTTQEAYNNATDAFADRLEQKDTELTAKEEAIVYTNDCKKELNTQISEQETTVSDCKTKVNDAKAKVSDINSQISALGSAPPTTLSVTDEEGNTTTIPNPAYEAWVAQKEALEAQLAEAENEQADAEVELADAEDELTNLEAELDQLETALNAAIEDYMQTEEIADQELQTLKTDIDNANKEYTEAKAAEQTITAPFDTEIEKAKADLRAYDDAMEIEEMPEDWTKEEKAGLEEVDKSNIPADYEVKSDGKIYDAEGNVVGKVVSGSEDETTGEKTEDKYYLEKEEEKPRMPFTAKYDMARNLARGKTTDDGEFDPDATWGAYDFSNMSAEDIAMVAEIYEAEMADNQADAVDKATQGLPASFVEAAEKYLKDEEGTAEQFNAIVGGLLEESEENEKAAEMLNREVDSALETGDTAVIDALIANADSNYEEFMKYVSDTGLPAKIQEKMGEKAGEMLGEVYSKVDQHKGSDAESYGIETERAEELKSDYLSGDANKNLKKVIEDINKGKLTDPEEINYLLAQFGSSSEIMEVANELVESGKIKAEDLNTIFRVSTTKQAEIMDAVNSDAELAKYLEEQGLDPMKSSQSDLDTAITEYEYKNSAASKNKITDEQIDKYLGGGLDKAFEKVKDDPEKLKASAEKMMSKIINSNELSPSEKTRLLQEIKSYNEDASEAVKEYLSKDDSFMADAMKEMSKNSDEYTTQDKIDFLKQYVGLQESLALFDGNTSIASSINNATMEEIVKLYEESTPEQMKELMTYVTPSVVAKGIQSETSSGTEEKLLGRLMSAVSGADESGKVSTKAEDYGLSATEAEEAKKKYIDGNADKGESIKEILDASKSGEISQDVAKYLLAEISGGSPESLVEELRDMSSADQESYIKELYGVYTPPVELPAEPSETDAATDADSADKATTKSNKPADTLEEFLSSISDPTIKGWYEQLFSEGMYDYDTFWDMSNIPKEFQSVYTEAFATGTIRSAGCGITSLSMLSEYLTGKHLFPNELTRGYLGNNPASALEKGLNSMGVEYQRLFGQTALDNLDSALEAGTPVIVNYRGTSSLFTNAGHFVVITGKTEDGKYIVNDPNIENYLKPSMVDGFTNGFTRDEIARGLNHIYFFQ